MLNVAVIMGGVSSEREISLRSGKAVANSIDRTKYNVKEVVLDGKTDIFQKLDGVDFALLILHGAFGEDGTVQSILEALDIPYSGCGPLTSALCMDKNMTKKILAQANVPTANWTTAKDINNIDYDKIEEIGYPLFIKPNNGGSSVATFLINEKSDVENAVKEVLKYDKEAMIEGYIKGEEYTSFILNGEVFPTVSIKTENDFFDFEAKYSTDGSGAKEEVVYLEKELQERVNDVTKKTWDALNCEVYCRVDVIISNGIPYVLEVNTLPGMTETSLIPRSAKAAGISYSELIDKIIEYSLQKRK